ncbi:MAG: AMP-binding protein [Candidatus Microbacterium colombiense]|nr:MAG: AMP-binding protein [Microbacterium sp.]
MTGTHHFVASALKRLAERDPARTAIVSAEAKKITVRELDELVSRAHERFVGKGMRPGEAVVIVADRSVQFIVTLLAVWKAGAVPAPVDAGNPQSRIRRMISESQASWQVTVEHAHATAVRLTDLRTDLPAEASHVLFTSGSAGVPKAVIVGHGALEMMARTYPSVFDVDHHDRFALTGGVGHDPVLRDIVMSLHLGSELHIPAKEVFTAPGALAGFVQERGVTVLHATPALVEFGLLVGRGASSCLRRVICGGAQLTAAVAASIFSHAPEARLFNVYGATETPQIASAMEIPPMLAGLNPSAPLPVGSGFGSNRVRVEHDGGTQQVVVSGPHLALGYLPLDGPQAGFRRTAESADRPGEYFTGDSGTSDESGTVTVIGRIDRQVSLNGYRFALEEVEAAARSISHVQSCRAEMRQGPFGASLALHVALTPDERGAVSSRREIQRQLRDVLPAYAIPSAITVSPARLTANNKNAMSGTATHVGADRD